MKFFAFELAREIELMGIFKLNCVGCVRIYVKYFSDYDGQKLCST